MNKVKLQEDGSYKVWTTAAPEDGAANAAILKLLANHLHISPSWLSLKRGHAARQKVFEIK